MDIISPRDRSMEKMVEKPDCYDANLIRDCVTYNAPYVAIDDVGIIHVGNRTQAETFLCRSDAAAYIRSHGILYGDNYRRALIAHSPDRPDSRYCMHTDCIAQLNALGG